MTISSVNCKISNNDCQSPLLHYIPKRRPFFSTQACRAPPIQVLPTVPIATQANFTTIDSLSLCAPTVFLAVGRVPGLTSVTIAPPDASATREQRNARRAEVVGTAETETPAAAPRKLATANLADKAGSRTSRVWPAGRIVLSAFQAALASSSREGPRTRPAAALRALPTATRTRPAGRSANLVSWARLRTTDLRIARYACREAFSTPDSAQPFAAIAARDRLLTSRRR